MAYVDALVFQERNGTTPERFYAVQDANWNVTALLTKEGSLWTGVQRFVYDPYGRAYVINGDGELERIESTNPNDWSYFHQGGYYSVGTGRDGLYHFRHRSYNPRMGRWLQRDPAGFVDGLDLHEYVGGNPVNRVDPRGEAAHVVAGAVVGGVLGAVSYLFEWATNPNAEFDLGRLLLYSGAGAASGAVASATFGASLAYTGGASLTATASGVIATTASGVTGGLVNGAIVGGGKTAMDGGSLGDVFAATFTGGFEGAVYGGIGGAVGGRLLGHFGAGLRGAVASGFGGGAVSGAIHGGLKGLEEDGFSGLLNGAIHGGVMGGFTGAAFGGGGFGVGRVAGALNNRITIGPSWLRWGGIQRLPQQPSSIPNYSTGRGGDVAFSSIQRGRMLSRMVRQLRVGKLLVRTHTSKQTRDTLQYGDLSSNSTRRRHHIKPISLGGPDIRANMLIMRPAPHARIHPSNQVRRSPVGTIFVG